MSTTTDPSANACVSHPFSVEDPDDRADRTGSAFRAVGTHRGQIVGAISHEESRHPRMLQFVPDAGTNSQRRRDIRGTNVALSRPRDTSHEATCNASQGRPGHLETGGWSQHYNAPCVSFHSGSVRGEPAGLRSDTIGPGVFFERPVITNAFPQRHSLQQAKGNSDKRLRRRSKRTNMPEDASSGAGSETAPGSGHPGADNRVDRVLESDYSATNGGSTRRDNGNVTSTNTRNRLSNNLELLSRPSWCDAKFAYDQVLQGKASGNKSALWFRSKVHRALFCLGCFVQRKAGYVLIPCLLVLAACAFGLKYASLETRVDKLWVESGGKLEEELEYSSKSIGNDSTTTWQLLIHTGEDTSTVESLKLHREAAIAATEVTVTIYGQTWEISDLCYKEVPDLGEISPIVEAFISKLFPCFIMTPLDCFWEGSELLGPSTPLPSMPLNGEVFPAYTWKNLDPIEVVDRLSYIKDVLPFKQLIEDAGVGHGYLDRWCLNPHNPECPDMAPNKVSKEEPDIKAMFARGCEGYATKFMKWPNDLIVGGIERDANGNVIRAKGLQTLIQLMGPENMYNFHKDSVKTSQMRWSLDKATNVLLTWQRKFVEEMYGIQANASLAESDEIHAFAPSTAQDLILEFSNFSILRVAAGYLLMLAYACFTMLRCKASRSQGAVGVIGVVLVCLSVMAGLGICSVIGIKFNAATTQVLPFLMLGLGVDDMFLIAHQFGEIACLTYIPFEERTGECIKRVGVSVLLTSIAILSGFLFSMIIPMPALQSFALQAAVITCFNLFCVLIVFPAALSIDLRRRRSNRLDIFCCFKSSSANDVVEFTDYNIAITRPEPQYDHGPAPVHPTALPAGPQAPPLDGEATITMHHTIQAYSNESYVTFLGPAAETTFTTGNGNPSDAPAPGSLPQYYPPLTPPPRYTPDPSKTTTTNPPAAPRIAFQEPGPSNGEAAAASNSRESAPHGTAARTIQNRPNSGTSTPKAKSNKTSSNLVTPMVSVRSSTHSLVPSNNRDSKWFCWPRSGSNRQQYNYICCLPLLTVTDFAKKYYGPFMMKTPVRVIVLSLCAALLGGSIYGCLKVRDGLDLVDVLPRDTREHDALSAQLEYFSFYNMLIVTKDFDYAEKQKELHMFHHNLTELKYVVRNSDGTKTKFWLEYFRDWLQGLQNAFDADWTAGSINESTWTPQTSDEGVLAFKLLMQTGKFEDPTDKNRIGCQPPLNKPCPRVNIVRLVSDDGIIREDAFYNYLSAWVQNDPLAYIASLGDIRPIPKKWELQRNNNNEIPRSDRPTYAQMPYFLNGLRENEDFVEVIKAVRALCDQYETVGVYSYPSGYPFLFWQQYISLRQWLFIAMGAAIVGISLVVCLVLLNPWAAAITCFFLITITTELLGFMGLAGVKLSAVPAVILVAAIGLGVEFTVHITLAHITSCGSRIDRSKAAIAHMMGPVIDGAISTFLGVVMLSGSEFDFIIRYFFQVLSVLVLIGLWNGIFVLPVVLSFIGPPPEVVPLGGGNRLKTPTPPPTPPPDDNDDHACHHNCNNNHIRRHTHHQRECPLWHGYSSRDDMAYMQRGMYGHGACHRPYPNSRRLFDERCHPGPSSMHPYDYTDPRIQYRMRAAYCNPHSVGSSGSSTPRAALDDGRVVIYPSADFVVYSPNDVRAMNSERVQHCDPSIRISTNNEPGSGSSNAGGVMVNRRPAESSSSSSGTTRDSNSTPSSQELGQHIATLTSSVTLKVRPSRYQQYAIYPPTSSKVENPRSDVPSTIDVKFYPISHQPGSVRSQEHIAPPYTSHPVDGAPEQDSAINSESSPDDGRHASNRDVTSEAADTAFQRLNADDVAE